MDILGQQPVEPISFGRLRHAFVTAAQDGDAPAAGLQRPREFFHHRCLTRSADREIPDANDKAAKRALAEDSFVNKRERVKNSAQNRGAKSAAPLKHHVDSELL